MTTARLQLRKDREGSGSLRQQLHHLAQAAIPGVAAGFVAATVARRLALPSSALAMALMDGTGGSIEVLWDASPESVWDAARGTLGGIAVAAAAATTAMEGWPSGEEFLVGEGLNERLARIDTTSRQALPGIVRRTVAMAALAFPAQIAVVRAQWGLDTPRATQVSNFLRGLTEAGLASDRMMPRVEHLAEALLEQRARVIATTETMEAVLQGQQAAWVAAAATGIVDGAQVRRRWVLGAAPCKYCASIPDHNAAGVGLTDTFSTPYGQVLNPPVHPNCFCSIEITDAAI